MDSSETSDIERQFQVELEALEKFRLAYTGMHKVPLAGDDPDVRRLLEALAFFTARTRLAAERNVDQSLFRIFRQHFPYLLSPIPAMGMLQATPMRKLVDATDVPAGTDVDLVKRTERAPDRSFHFRTLAPLSLLPISVRSVEKIPGFDAPSSIAITFAAPFALSTAVDHIDLHLDYLNDLSSSLLAFSELRRHVTRASVVWERVDAQGVVTPTPRESCSIQFGAPPLDGSVAPIFEHPIQRIRASLHFPQQDLYLRIRGLRAPALWRTFTVSLEIDDDWPANLQLNRDYFRLHTVPIVNLQRESADPIEHDGTKERHLARHPVSREGFVPVEVRGAYLMTKTGLVPLEPTVIGTKQASYEALVERHGVDRRAWISLSLPGAFEKPETVVVDALWHQPDIVNVRAAALQPQLVKRAVDASFALVAGLSSPLEVVVDEDREALLQLLAIKGQALLGLDEIRFLLRGMGVLDDSTFSRTLAALIDVRVTDRPSGKRSRSLKHVYAIQIGPVGATELPRIEVFCARLFELLAAWSGEDVLELKVEIPSLKQTLNFPSVILVSE